LATTAAAVSGRIIPGYTEIASGVLSQGAYESNLQWTAGVNGVGLAPSVLKLEATSNSDTPPKLCVHQTTDNLLTITAPPAAEAYQLYVTTNLHPPVVWFAVTNVPSVSSTQWSVALPVSQDSQRWFCLQSKN